MKYCVEYTDAAVTDLKDIGQYIATHDEPERADYVINGIMRTVSRLQHSPFYARVPELLEYGVEQYRQVRWKPYRIIYEIQENNTVMIVAVIDGRRDVNEFLRQRFSIDGGT
ncbi:plasmid stabilization protein [Planctomycetales bacterium]|nr:plasmid stabilization protein [Planctomycetales bacterium]